MISASFKTEKEIQLYFIDLISDTPLSRLVSGQIYHFGTRPPNSTKEDIVVRFITGHNADISDGYVMYQIYVPDLIAEGVSMENQPRTKLIERSLLDFLASLRPSEYYLTLEDPIVSEEAKEISQHFVVAKLYFKTLTI